MLSNKLQKQVKGLFQVDNVYQETVFLYIQKGNCMVIVYNILRYFLYGIILVVSIFNRKLRIFFSKRLKQNLNSRKFLNSQNEAILIHMSSVGEFNLSKDLIDSLILKGENIIL